MKNLILFVVLSLSGALFADAPKYVFLFIGDGMSAAQRNVAESFSKAIGRGELAMNHLKYTGSTMTGSANALVTDSAAAATAIACGVKANNGQLGIDPQGSNLVSCAYAAKAAGKKVGIMTTVTITHATPAGFYAHRKSRGDTYGIAVDLVNSGFDFFAGGGLDHGYKNAGHPEFAKYGHAYHYAEKEGYKVVRTREEFLKLKPKDGKILTRFTDGYLAKAIDPRPAEQPTLAEIVGKAIEMLDNPNGFFMMAEGGLVDWAGHANDAGSNLREVIDLDEAVKVAIAFQKKHPKETLIVVTGDHETGGLVMGLAGTGTMMHPERLAKQTISSDAFSNQVADEFRKNPNMTFEDAKKLAEKGFGFKFKGDAKRDPMVLTENEIAELKKAFDHDLAFHKAKIEENTKYDGEKRYIYGGTCRRVLASKCGLNWNTGSHTAAPVLTTAGGKCAELFEGNYENTGIAERLKGLYEKK